MEGIRQDTRQAVESLQAQVARLKAAFWLLFLLLLGAGSYLAWQHFHPKVAPDILRVKGLTVVDEQGQVRMVLTASGIRISDEQGQARAGLSLVEDGAQLTLNNPQGIPAVSALASPNQGGSLTLSDPKRGTVMLGTAPGPTVQLHQGDKLLFKQPYDAKELK